MPNKWIKVPELNIEVEKNLQHVGIPFKNIKIPPNQRILTETELLFLAYSPKYNFLCRDTYEYALQEYSKQIIAVFPSSFVYGLDYFKSWLYQNGIRFVKPLFK